MISQADFLAGEVQFSEHAQSNRFVFSPNYSPNKALCTITSHSQNSPPSLVARLVLKHGMPERRNTKTRNTKLLKPGTHEK